MIDNPLSALNGETIYSVCFVADYVEFHFGTPVLRALVLPELKVEGVALVPTHGVYHQQLCALIGATVMSCEFAEGVHIRLRLSRKREILIRLDKPDPSSGEAAHFVPLGEGAIQVF